MDPGTIGQVRIAAREKPAEVLLQSAVEARRRAAFAAEIEIIQSGGKHGVEQKIHDFLLRFFRSKSESRAQRLNRRAPSTLAVSATEV